MTKVISVIIVFSFFIASCGQQKSKTEISHDDSKQTTHAQIEINTPDDALAIKIRKPEVCGWQDD